MFFHKHGPKHHSLNVVANVCVRLFGPTIILVGPFQFSSFVYIETDKTFSGITIIDSQT